MFNRIVDFMELGGQEVPSNPIVAKGDGKKLQEDALNILGFVKSEVEETEEALHAIDQAEALDGFLDIAFVAITGALRVAGLRAAKEAWDAIVKANLSKVDWSIGPAKNDPETGKVLKPGGWKAPDIEGILKKDPSNWVDFFVEFDWDRIDISAASPSSDGTPREASLSGCYPEINTFPPEGQEYLYRLIRSSLQQNSRVLGFSEYTPVALLNRLPSCESLISKVQRDLRWHRKG